MSQCAVSVIIPTYNHGGLVLQTIESVLSQSFKDYEIIVINDGSPDDTENVLLPLIKDRTIRYIYQANGGQAAARNRGIQEAIGEFIAFLDDDDLWPIDKLQWQVNALRERRDMIAVAGLSIAFDAYGRHEQVGWRVPVLSVKSLFKGNPIWTPGQVLIRNSTLHQLKGFDPEIWGADDYDLWFRLVKVGHMEMWDQVGVYYRLHDHNASRQMQRLLAACRAVIRKHLNALPRQERHACMKDGYEFLYRSWGQAVSIHAKNELKRLRFFSAFRNIWTLLQIACESPRESKLASKIARDLAPGPCWHWLNKSTA